MKAQTVNIDLEMLGASFINLDSIEQTKFFRGMARELRTWDSNVRKQTQFAYIGAELSDEEKEEISNALQMIMHESYLKQTKGDKQ